jgi:hypothetical protein
LLLWKFWDALLIFNNTCWVCLWKLHY